jgi:hypothetical protein
MATKVTIVFDKDEDAVRLYEAATEGHSFNFNPLGELRDDDSWKPSYIPMFERGVPTRCTFCSEPVDDGHVHVGGY